MHGPPYPCPHSPSGWHELAPALGVEYRVPFATSPAGSWLRLECRHCGRPGRVWVADASIEWEPGPGAR